MSCLKNIQELNLNGNPIDDIISAVDSLNTMPSLKALQINLHEEEQVDYLLRTLVDLQYLNGLAVEREALFNDNDSPVIQEDDNIPEYFENNQFLSNDLNQIEEDQKAEEEESTI